MGSVRVETLWGDFFINFGARGIKRLFFPGTDIPDITGDDKLGPAEGLGNVSSLLVRYFKGEMITFDDIKVDLKGKSEFFLRVCEVVRTIEYGTVKSYGQVASLAGRPGAARAVGRVMAMNPVPIIVPCHRVVASNGDLTGFSASGGIDTKKKLLALESQ